MATAVGEKIYTPEDLLAITDRPMPELIDGQLVERPTIGVKSDAIAFRLGRWVGNHVDAEDPGLVLGAQGSYQIFPDDPRKVRIPDASFVRKDRLPATGVPGGHFKVVPGLVVEVDSPSDTAADRDEKVEDFLRAGVPLIWVVNPDTRTVQVHRPGGTDSRLRPGDSLVGEDVLPGFRCEVARLFEGL